MAESHRCMWANLRPGGSFPCNSNFSSGTRLHRHLQEHVDQHHHDLRVRGSVLRPCLWQGCSFQSTLKGVRSHIHTHAPKEYSCNGCGKTYRQIQGLRRHVRDSCMRPPPPGSRLAGIPDEKDSEADSQENSDVSELVDHSGAASTPPPAAVAANKFPFPRAGGPSADASAGGAPWLDMMQPRAEPPESQGGLPYFLRPQSPTFNFSKPNTPGDDGGLGMGALPHSQGGARPDQRQPPFLVSLRIPGYGTPTRDDGPSGDAGGGQARGGNGSGMAGNGGPSILGEDEPRVGMHPFPSYTGRFSGLPELPRGPDAPIAPIGMPQYTGPIGPMMPLHRPVPDAGNAIGELVMDATREGNYAALEFLSRKVHPQSVPALKDQRGRTAMHFAAGRGWLQFVELLIGMCQPQIVRMQDMEGRMPHHLAVIRNRRAIAELLFKHGADPNAADFEGRTSVHLASIFRSEFSYLVSKYDARFVIRDNHSKTPADYLTNRIDLPDDPDLNVGPPMIIAPAVQQVLQPTPPQQHGGQGDRGGNGYRRQGPAFFDIGDRDRDPNPFLLL